MPAPSYVQTHTAQVDESGGSSVTLSNFDVGSGTNRSLIAFFFMLDYDAVAPTGSSIVFNTSENFTFRVRATQSWSSGNAHAVVEIWTLDNPSNATANIVANASENCSHAIGLAVIECTGANNGVGANTGSANGYGTAKDVTFTTGASDSLILAASMVEELLDYSTPGTGVTERADWAPWYGCAWAGHKAASGGSDTVATTADTSTNWAMAAIELKAASTGATVTLNTLTLASSIPAGDAVPGAVTKTMATLSLAGSVPVASLQAMTTLALQTLSLASSVPAGDVVPGAVSVLLAALSLAGSIPAASISSPGGPLSITLATISLSGSVPQGLVSSPAPGVNVTLAAITLAGSVPAAGLNPGAVSVLLDTLDLLGSVPPLSVSIANAPQSLSLDTLTLQSLIASLVTGGRRREQLDWLYRKSRKPR